MTYEVEINGRIRQVAVRRLDGRYAVAIDDREWIVDVTPVGAHALALLLEGGGRPGAAGPEGAGAGGRALSREVTVAPDPASGQLSVLVCGVPMAVALNGRRRSGRKEDGAHAGTGPQRIVAPMPGKIVRVVVGVGDRVVARQPLIVIEAMKMENELRAGGDGTVAEVHVQDGQSVNGGALLAVIATG